MGINLPDITPFGFKQVNTGAQLNDGLGDLLPDSFNKVNNNFGLLTTHLREKLESNRTYYVVSTGNDSNSGLSTLLPFATIQAAINKIYKSIDFNGYTVTIQLGDGVYTEAVIINGTPVGANSSNEYPLIIKGNSSSPGNTVWQAPGASGSEFALTLQSGARIYLQHLKFQSSSLTNADSNTTTRRFLVGSTKGSQLAITNLIFGAMATQYTSHLYSNESVITIKGNYSITGSAENHILAEQNGLILTSTGANIVVTVSTTPIFIHFLKAINYSLISLKQFGLTTIYTGNAVGKQYLKDAFSSISNLTSFTFPTSLTAGENLLLEINSATRFNAPIETNSTTVLNGAATLNSTLTVNNTSSFVGAIAAHNASFSGAVSLASTLSVTGAATFGNNLTVTQNALFNGTTTIAGPSLINGASIINGTATYNGTVTFNGTVNLPNGSVTRANFSASGSSGAAGNSGDVLIINTGVVGGLVWSNRLTVAENNILLKAPLANPTFTGLVSVPTLDISNSSSAAASTAFVHNFLDNRTDQITTVIRNRLPLGVIMLWSGEISTIPSGFVICDGTNGTPDLRNKFVLGAGKQTGQAFCIGETGGAATQTIRSSQLFTDAKSVGAGTLYAVPHALSEAEMPPHRHIDVPTALYVGGNQYPINSGGSAGKKGSNSSVAAYVSQTSHNTRGSGAAHGHLIAGATEQHFHTINIPDTTVSIMPPYYVLAYIMRATN